MHPISTDIFPPIPESLQGPSRVWTRQELHKYMSRYTPFGWNPEKVDWCMRFYAAEFMRAVEFDFYSQQKDIALRITAKPWRKFDKSALYIYGGEAFTMKQWAALTGIPLRTITARFTWGWPAERAITEPVGASVVRGVAGRPAKPGSLCDRVIKLCDRVVELESRVATLEARLEEKS